MCRRSLGELRVIQSMKRKDQSKRIKTAKKAQKKKQKEHSSVWRLGLQFSINYAKYSHSQSGIWLPSVCLGQRGCSRTVKGRADGKKVKRLCKQNGNKGYFIYGLSYASRLQAPVGRLAVKSIVNMP